MNKVILSGAVVNDVKLNKTNSDVSVCNITLKTVNVLNFPSGEKTFTDFHKIVVWKEKAEKISNQVEKDDLIYIEGQLKTKKQDDHPTSEVVINNDGEFKILSKSLKKKQNIEQEKKQEQDEEIKESA